MAITRFEQDVTKPFGQGNFVDDQGRSMYLNDPETAQRFVSTMPGQTAKKALAEQMAEETDAIATAQLGSVSPPTQPDARTAMNDTGLPVNVGDVSAPVPGIAPVGTPPTPAAVDSAAQKLVGGAIGARDQLKQLRAPKAPGSQLPVSNTSATNTRSVIKGRDAANVQAQIGEEAEAGEALDTTILDSATNRDAKVDQAIRVQQSGLTDVQARENARLSSAQSKQQAYQAQVAKLNAELEASDKSLDPDRVVNNMSTGKKIGMVLLAALSGGFAHLAGQRGGENQVLGLINAQIDADIDKQKAEIASGRIRIGNHINEFMRKGFDAETAEKLARDRLDGAVAGMTELEAKRIGASGENAQQAQLLIAQRGEQRAARRGDLLAQTEDRVQTGSQTTVNREAPKAAGLSPSDELAQMKIADAQLEKANAEEVGKALGHEVTADEAKKVKDDAQDYSIRVANNMVTKQTVEALAKQIGLRREGKTWVMTDDADPGVRPFGSTTFSPKAREVDRLWSQLKEAKIMNMSREPANTLQREFGEAVDRPFNDADIPKILNMVEARANDANQVLREGYKDAAKFYDYGRTNKPDEGYVAGKARPHALPPAGTTPPGVAVNR